MMDKYNFQISSDIDTKKTLVIDFELMLFINERLRKKEVITDSMYQKAKEVILHKQWSKNLGST